MAMVCGRTCATPIVRYDLFLVGFVLEAIATDVLDAIAVWVRPDYPTLAFAPFFPNTRNMK